MIELNTLKCKPMLLAKHYLEQKKNDLIHIPFPSDINKHEFGVLSMHSTIHTQKNTKNRPRNK
jgi:hypothetical protein